MEITVCSQWFKLSIKMRCKAAVLRCHGVFLTKNEALLLAISSTSVLLNVLYNFATSRLASNFARLKMDLKCIIRCFENVPSSHNLFETVSAKWLFMIVLDKLEYVISILETLS